jgi:hypothetical protein
MNLMCYTYYISSGDVNVISSGDVEILHASSCNLLLLHFPSGSGRLRQRFNCHTGKESESGHDLLHLVRVVFLDCTYAPRRIATLGFYWPFSTYGE